MMFIMYLSQKEALFLMLTFLKLAGKIESGDERKRLQQKYARLCFMPGSNERPPVVTMIQDWRSTT